MVRYVVMEVWPSSDGRGWGYELLSPEGAVLKCFHGGEYTRDQIFEIAQKAADSLTKQYGDRRGPVDMRGRKDARKFRQKIFCQKNEV